MSNSKPRVHKDLDHLTYFPKIGTIDPPPRLWDMRYDPRERGGVFNAPRFPYRFNYYGPRTTAVMPRVDRLCVLFRYHPTVSSFWTFDITHLGAPTGQDGYAVTAEDVLGGIYEQLRFEPSEEDRRNCEEHNQAAERARIERCELFKLDKKREPVRRIDYVKGVLGYCAFAGLSGYDRHLSTPLLRIYLTDVPFFF
ncbi:hypothetical protein EW145_g1608 [Phellinidium pouzarii]|uniref:DUF6699 domain-containing protein n=1 Tax=Phellinidium pouzarii TaxID=167371 RepID=A0A4S4LEG2_9AGAM|nr:hypothetical protein EW145_g1608 [Phellinidium pouzarii]